MTFQAPITIKTALDRMHRHDYVLPAIQREFVWDQDRIVRLFDSLMRGYPIGSFLFWNIEPKQAADYTTSTTTSSVTSTAVTGPTASGCTSGPTGR